MVFKCVHVFVFCFCVLLLQIEKEEATAAAVAAVFAVIVAGEYTTTITNTWQMCV